MNRNDDPLEQLLEHAFAEELTRTTDPDVVRRVIRQIMMRQRIRLVALGSAVVAGLWVAITALLPVVANLGAWLQPLQTLPEMLTTLGPLALLILLPPCTFLLLEDGL